MDLCLICLRTDRLLKLSSSVLEEFHDELCDYSIVAMSSFSYCLECEYLLTKFYKFKEKCGMAVKIYQKWISEKDSKKQPINVLYTLLPPTSLGVCDPNSEKIRNSTFYATDAQTDMSFEDELMKEAYNKKVKLEYDASFDSENTFADVLNIDFTMPNNIPKLEHIDDIKSDSETEEQNLFDSLEAALDSEESKHAKDTEGDSENEMEPDVRSEKRPVKKCLKSKKLVRKTKKTERDVENLPKKPGKKMSAKKKAYFERFRENDKQYESVFEIEHLVTQEMKLEEFKKRNTYDTYVNAEHKCEICYQVVKSSKFLKYHTDKWHNESPDTVLCPICKTWNSKRSKHRRTHAVVYKCKMCPLITHHRKTMQNHFEQHKGKRYHCEECDTTYKSQSAYSNHVGKIHRRGRNVCERCGRGFGTPLGLAIHKNTSARCTGRAGGEAGAPPVRCDECDVTLPSQEVYLAHVVDVHSAPRDSRPLAVDGAGLPEHRVRKARKYVRRTNMPVKHTCRVCNKVGTTYGWLQLHFKKEHPNEDMDVLYADKKTHLCDICGTGLSNLYALRDHMNIHTGARPHACDICPKKFRSAHLLREHRVRHFPSTLPCSYCGKTFKTRGNLYTHMKVHTGEKEHKCEICGKAFLYVVNLNEHVRGVHYNIRRVRRGAREGVAETGGVDAAGGGAAKRRKLADVETDFGSDSSV